MNSNTVQTSSKQELHNQESSSSQVLPKQVSYPSSVPISSEYSKELSTFTFVDSDEDTALPRPQLEKSETSKPSKGHHPTDKEFKEDHIESIKRNHHKQQEYHLQEEKKRQTSAVVMGETQQPETKIKLEPVERIQSGGGEQRSNRRVSVVSGFQKSEKKNVTCGSEEKDIRGSMSNLQRRAKSLSVLKETSPRNVGDIGLCAGTVIKEACSPSSSRMRGRTASRTSSNQKRSQTPAAPALNLSDYGSDDDIEAADLAESVCVYEGTLGKKKVSKSSLRNMKPQEKQTSILRQRRQTTELRQTTSFTPSQNSQNSMNNKISPRGRVTFQASEETISAVKGIKQKVQCHTPFPRGTPKLLASESEDSDDLSFQESPNANSAGGSLRLVADHSNNPMGELNRDERPMPAAPLRPSACTADGAYFTNYFNATVPRRNYLHKSRNSAQGSHFVRIGGRRNILTFEPAIETTNILPAPPTTSNPPLVPASYCSRCGHRVLNV